MLDCIDVCLSETISLKNAWWRSLATTWYLKHLQDKLQDCILF